ncbi:MAG: hypothetical protein HYR96_08950 [Deltaproteobacteria bacterium]|nr:hypothetical protein [Deltaproteobacteria bacterium]MBI3293830.1 hypothetical protein [Deltaproteobacteria bacterium]
MKWGKFFAHTLDLAGLVIKHVVRTRLVYLVFAFSVLSQIGGLKLTHEGLSASAGLLPTLKSQQSVFIALFLELFGGVMLCVVYGVWVVPYLHSGSRAQLTLVLPVRRAAFACSGAIGLLALLLVQFATMIVVYGYVLGFGGLAPAVFPWQYFFIGAALESLCFLSLTFLFSALSVSTGPITAFFLGVTVLSGLQFGGVLKAVGKFLASKGMQTGSFLDWVKIYDLLLPVGELVFQLKVIGTSEINLGVALAKWVVWIVVLAVTYVVTISRIRRFKASV